MTDSTTEGVYAAVLTLMDGVGNYPMTRDDILHAVEEGVRRAFADLLTAAPTPDDNSTPTRSTP